MDLMTLAAKLTLDDSDYVSGVKNAESAGEKLAGKLSSMTVAVGQIVADMMRRAISGINSVIQGAIGGYADYQQLIGGVETLFKSSADKVAAYARESFRTTGLSANDYMETVTSFSASLLQGLQGDTEAAAELANMAIQDMADNANKMGTDISSIQAAYQGFAKRNFTMLDNLKLGYGGTESEMIRLVNDSHILDHEISSLDEITFDQLVEAIHQIQTEMGITGTTAEEAEKTITGSAASMKAAWEDMLAAIGGEGEQSRLDESIENFKTSFGSYMENLIPTIVTTIANSGTLVEAVAGAIASLPTDLLAKIGENAIEAGTDMVYGLKDLTGWLIESISNMFKSAKADEGKVAELGVAIGDFLGTAIKDIVVNAPDILASITTVGINLAGGLLKGLWLGLFGSEGDSELDRINSEFEGKVLDTEISSARASAILDYMESLAEEYGDAVTETEEWMRAQDELEEVLGGSKDVFAQYGDNIQGAIDKLKDMSEELRRLAIQQAMQDKLSEQYRLLGEYNFQKFSAEEEIKYARGNLETIQRQADTTAMSYIAEMQRLLDGLSYDQIQNEIGADVVETNRQLLAQIQEQIDLGEGIDINDIKNLGEALSSLYRSLEIGEEDRVWSLSPYDDILDPTVLAGLNAEYELQEKAIRDAEAAIDDANEGIQSVTRQIEITENAIERAAKELGVSLGTSGQQMVDAATYFASQIRSMGSSVATSDRVSPAFERSGYSYMPRAVGLDYAPYDGFRAELHRGEAIITREENERRGGYDIEVIEQRLEDAIERSMARMQINMDGQRVADLTTRRTERNISGYEHSRVLAMGG